MRARRLLCIGECMVELSPVKGGLLRQGYAGDTLNAAWYARQLLPAGVHVDFGSAVGTDIASEGLLAFLHEAGIGISAIRIIRGGKLGLYMIHLDDHGERSFSYWRDTSAARQLADDGPALRAAIEQSDAMHFSGITLAILRAEARETLLAELRRAKASGKIVSFDPNIRPVLWENPRIMRDACTAAARASTVLLPGLDEENRHFGMERAEDVIARYHGLGVGLVVVKRGAEGAMLGFDRRIVSIPAAPQPVVVDTTAAGDSFDGAFIARLMAGESPERAARVAALAAAEVIGERGALIRLSGAGSRPDRPVEKSV